ncbi:hypothetical protein [Streptococcus anginosus]|uniref:Uncharacterized protein n=2 Tax=Streptococcus TaxID=1301 RepID=A0ACC7PMU9_STRAP|nr:hypothetical protein [Streptococcus anginosus]
MFNRRDVPLINKNDMVFVVELKVSNNDDTLSTQIAFMVQVELLVLLIDVDSFIRQILFIIQMQRA